MNAGLYHASVLCDSRLADAILKWKLRRFPMAYEFTKHIFNPLVANTLSCISQGSTRHPQSKRLIPPTADVERIQLPRDQELQVFEGNCENQSTTLFAIVASWDPDGIVDPYVFQTIKDLAAEGFRTLLVSASGSIRACDLNQLKPITEAIILRHNIGYDFRSYQTGIDYLAKSDALGDAQGLLLINDSIVGPFESFPACLKRLTLQVDGLWGLNDSYFHSHHLQSFFLYFPRAVLQSNTFREFWGSIEPNLRKQDIVTRYEIGLSRAFLESGFSIHPLFPTKEVAEAARVILSELLRPYFTDSILKLDEINPPLLFWSILIDLFHYPFVKRSVLFAQPRLLKPAGSPLEFLTGTDPIIPTIENFMNRVRPAFEK